MPSFESRVERLWTNPKRVRVSAPFVYFISVSDENGNEYRYVGRARDKSRLEEYKRNMAKIRARKPRGKKQKYRAVHFVLYKAIENDWDIAFHPYEECSESQLNEVENRLISDLACNLNSASTWPIEKLSTLTIKELLENA